MIVKMGQSPSRPPSIKTARRRSLRSPFSRRSKFNSSNLSHTFNISTINENVDLLNVNFASEEQLMTLPGINRRLAQAIVEHRQAIGHFRRIDDIALVSGMGADKLNLIKGEICVSRKLPSSTDSRTQSLDSVCSSESSRVNLNINTVNVFQLQCVPGLNQELAASIVDYRKRKGPFRSLDDLLKVKGMNVMRLGAVKSQLNVGPADDGLSLSTLGNDYLNNNSNSRRTLQMYQSNKSLNSAKGVGRPALTSPPPLKMNTLPNGYSSVPLDDIFDLLSAYSYRPIIEDEFNYQKDNKPAIRIATWNLHKLSLEKTNNPGFKEVLCRTILENRFSVLAVQEVLQEEALKNICNELNNPSLRRVMEWKENSRLWQYHILSTNTQNGNKFGFLYDTFSGNIKINLNSHYETHEIGNDEEDGENEQEPIISKSLTLNYCIADFTIDEMRLLIVNIHLTEKNSDYQAALLCEMIDKLLTTGRRVILVGDFYSAENLKDLATCYKSVIDLKSGLTAESGETAGKGGMLVGGGGEESCGFAGNSGIVRSGLTHLAIPRGWSWGGPASPHCPIWAEFYA